MPRIRRLPWVVCLLIVAIPLCAQAQEKTDQSGGTASTLGLRAGFGLDPDQFVVGGQVSMGKKLGIARVVPSVDVGFGNSTTTIAFNADVQFKLNVEGSSFGLYGGAGPTVLYWDNEGGSSDWELGLSLMAGARMPFKSFPPTSLEVRFGMGDIPDFRALLILEF